MNDKRKLAEIVELLDECGDYDGSHHKQWCIDQTMRIALGRRKYGAWRRQREKDGYCWDEGITP